MWICSALLLSLSMTTFAQTLEITPVTVDRGSANILRIILKPRSEKPIAALQWDLVYQDGLRIEPSGVVSGAASETAEKSVSCARKPSEGGANRLTCILAGGVKALSAGVIAIVRFEAAHDTPKGERSVDLEKVVGVSPALESIPMESTRTSITIR
ncbi:MAG: hypothetical protein JWO19_2350 [Bryobacterales bacterium]|nr:hypothetical protein [Bryobacterales bacterium]